MTDNPTENEENTGTPEQPENPPVKDDSQNPDITQDDAAPASEKDKMDQDEVFETFSEVSGEPPELTSGIYHQMLRLLQEAEEEKKKKEEEQNKKRLDELYKRLEEMQKEAAERTQNMSSANNQILDFIAGQRGDNVFEGGENAFKCTLFEEMNHTGFFDRLKKDGREIEINNQTGEMRIYYADGGHMSIRQNQHGNLTISLHGTKMDEQKAHDNVFMQKVCGKNRLTITGPKKGARLLWLAAQQQGMSTNDHTKGAFKPSKADIAMAAQNKQQEKDFIEQRQTMTLERQKLQDDGLLDLVSMSEQKFQNTTLDFMHGKMSYDDYMKTGDAYGRLQNLIGYDWDEKSQVRYMGTDLSTDDLKEIKEDLEKDFSPEMMEDIIDELNEESKQLKSLRMPEILDQQEQMLHMIEQQQKGVRAGISRFLAGKQARAENDAKMDNMRQAIEDSRSRYLPAHDPQNDTDLGGVTRFGRAKEEPKVKTAAELGSKIAKKPEKPPEMQEVGFMQTSAKPKTTTPK